MSFPPQALRGEWDKLRREGEWLRQSMTEAVIESDARALFELSRELIEHSLRRDDFDDRVAEYQERCKAGKDGLPGPPGIPASQP